MVTLVRIALHLIEDALRWVVLLFRSAEPCAPRISSCAGNWLFTSNGVSNRTGSTRLPASAWRYWQGCSIGAARWWSCSRRR
jgi:hypothetical protein